MNKHKLVGIVACLVMLAGCATPAAVKEATVALDQGFKDNLKMMRQYRALEIQINERHEYWWQYTKRRALLNLALEWATTNRQTGKDEVDRAIVSEAKSQLDSTLVSEINKIRLKDLPAREDASGVVFRQNTPTPEDPLRGTVGGIIQALPALINAIDAKVDSDYKAIVENDLSGFDDYKTNVKALARINSTIQRYLAIDVTVKAEDINAIADAIRKLQ